MTNRINLAALISTINGATFVGVDTVTEVKLKGGKKNEMQGRITKKMENASVMAFTNKNSNGYENMVNRRLAAEGKGEFELSPRKWGTRVEGAPIVKHEKNGVTKYYMEMIFMKAGKTTYFIDGDTPIEKEDIIGLETAGEGEQGGLEEKVVLRTFAVENITGMRIDGGSYNGNFFFKE